jgi:hypothetical protein
MPVANHSHAVQLVQLMVIVSPRSYNWDIAKEWEQHRLHLG